MQDFIFREIILYRNQKPNLCVCSSNQVLGFSFYKLHISKKKNLIVNHCMLFTCFFNKVIHHQTKNIIFKQ
jgi:hypothetical protein